MKKSWIFGTHVLEEIETKQSIVSNDDILMSKDIICKDKIWIESIKGKLACTFPNTSKKLVKRGLVYNAL